MLALILATRFKKPWTILLGVFIATVLNHALAAWAGAWFAQWLTPSILKWTLIIIFFSFAFWILIPDKESKLKSQNRFGALLTTIVAFFLAEMGDKTQIATIALGARFTNTVSVTLGTTLGMLASNALAIFLGEQLLKRIPMKWIRMFACILFLLFGIGILIGL